MRRLRPRLAQGLRGHSSEAGLRPGCGLQIQSSFADPTWGQVCFQAGLPDADCEQEESVQSGRATYSRKKQLSLEEKCQVPTGKHEQVTGAGQGSERPAPAGPMSQWETSFGPCLGGWEFHSIVEGWPEDPARG